MPYRRGTLWLCAALAVACQAPNPSPAPPITPSSAPSTAPSPAPSNTPQPTEPSAQPSVQPSAPTTGKLEGTVLGEDDNNPVVGARVTITSVSEDDPYEREVTTDNLGRFTVTDAPVGLNLDVTATKGGYTTRTLGAVVPPGSSASVRFDGRYGISSRPEVVDVSPSWGAKGIAPDTSFKLTFSTEMDKSSVERSFAIQMDRSSPLTLPVGAILPAGSLSGGSSTAIFDAGAFTIEWPNEREAVFRFRYGAQLPSLGGIDQPDYRLILTYTGRGAGEIKNSSGRAARAAVDNSSGGTGPFYLDGKLRPFARFQITDNDTSPRLDNMYLYNNRNGGNDEIELTFSGPMALAPRFYEGTNKLIAGGSGGSVGQAPAAHSGLSASDVAGNYRYRVNDGAWQPVTGTATFNGELDRRVVVLRFNSATAFEPGDTVEVGVGSSVTDPFGQTVSSRTLTGRVE